jgi:ceramide glucosyltransferase
LVADARAVGLNPKVNNLANLIRYARGELILINDSNVRLAPGYVSDMVARLAPDVGLVSSPFRGVAGRGIGAAFEALHINTYVMGGVAAMHRVFRGVCVVGKSMLLRRKTLDELGGFEFLSGFLAEDQVCGQEVARRGLRLELAALPVDNVLGDLDLEAFVARHLRWAKIRLAMNPAGYAGEFLLNPVFLALVALALLPGLAGAALAATTVLVKTILDSSSERAAGHRRPLLLTFALVLAKDALIGLLWPVPLVSRRVSWRGNVLRIGRRTRVIRPHSLLGAPPTPLLESGSAA